MKSKEHQIKIKISNKALPWSHLGYRKILRKNKVKKFRNYAKMKISYIRNKNIMETKQYKKFNFDI